MGPRARHVYRMPKVKKGRRSPHSSAHKHWSRLDWPPSCIQAHRTISLNRALINIAAINQKDNQPSAV